MTKKILLFLYYTIAQYLPMRPIPGWRVGYFIRRRMVERLLRYCGNDVIVKDRCYFGNGSRLSVGDRSQLGKNARLNGTVTIGNDVLMGPDVVMMATSHEWKNSNIPIIDQGETEERCINIGSNVWIGTRVIVLPGVSIGSNSIIGAGSIVTKSFPENSVICGNPAKLIKKLYVE